MDNTELHYLTYDESAIWEEMVLAYIGAGGDILYPGDEKEMLLRGVQQIIMQCFAGIDNALRMDTLRYAVRDYLDAYGEKRNCFRIQAAPAKATVTIVTNETGEAMTLPAGTAMTQDGSVFWTIDEALSLTGRQETLTAAITANTAGTVGNGLLAGMTMSMVNQTPAINSITVATDATGGQNEEEDEAYRQRIRNYGLAAVSTGPADQYRRAAMEVSSRILDAVAWNTGHGVVTVYILLAASDYEGINALCDQVLEALSPNDVRPLCDIVRVNMAFGYAYDLYVNYAADNGQNLNEAVEKAVREYQEWQDNVLGQAFNPDKLKAMLYAAGCKRVEFGEGSGHRYGSQNPVCVYTPVAPYERWCGNITLAVIDE